jgi:hypothetical protein
VFKAIDTETNQAVVSLDAKTEEQVSNLRQKGHSDLLQCQTCKEKVRLRAGGQRRAHFSHKTLANCPTKNESAEMLEARAVLYDFLKTKFSDAVTIEKHLDGSALPRPIDCWIEHQELKVAYWLIEGRLSEEDQSTISSTVAKHRASLVWVFLSTVIKRAGSDEKFLKLSTTERSLMATSELNLIHGATRSGTLHYLDSHAKTIATFRALSCIHRPQIYNGKEIRSPLTAINIRRGTGEFIHAGEWEAFVKVEAEIRRMKEQERLRKEERKSLQIPPSSIPPTRAYDFPPPQISSPHSSFLSGNRVAQCEFCGELTSDWWFYDGATGKCRCRKCQQKERGKGGST